MRESWCLVTPKYYECHITIEPAFGERLAEIKRIVHPWKFKVADLLMQKRGEDTPERSKFDTFCTGHSKDSFEDLKRRMVSCQMALIAADFKVWRSKIEAVLYDEHT
jgi:hypothetical protein